MGFVKFFLWIMIIFSFLSAVGSGAVIGNGVQTVIDSQIGIGIVQIVFGLVGFVASTGAMMYWYQETKESAHN